LRSFRHTDRNLNSGTQKIVIISTESTKPTANNSLVFIHHSHTHKKTHRIDKNLENLMENVCFARENSVQFFFSTVKLHSLTYSVWGS
jgi:hypothetical protein